MSVSLSLYDVFSNIVPGLIYLFTINEFLKVFGKSQIDLLQASTSGQILFIIVAAFVLGHLFTTFTYEGWYKLFVKRYEDKVALDKVANGYPDLKINFKPTDSELLFSVIRSRDKTVTERIEGFRANAIMMRNISFGLFLIGVVELTKFFMEKDAIGFLGLAVLSFIFSGLALRGASRFYKWFYYDVFRFSAIYGSTSLEVVRNFRREVAVKKVKTNI